jgi:hypothetical protein
LVAAIHNPSRRCQRAGGRSRAYHEKLVAMIHAEDQALVEHLGSIVHDLHRRIRVRKANEKW